MKEVSADLRLHESTVRTYRSRLLKKLELKSSAALIRYALEHGLAR